jgi:hypothetical protein
MIMSAPAIFPRVGMTPFWIGHANSFLWPQKWYEAFYGVSPGIPIAF